MTNYKLESAIELLQAEVDDVPLTKSKRERIDNCIKWVTEAASNPTGGN